MHGYLVRPLGLQFLLLKNNMVFKQTRRAMDHRSVITVRTVVSLDVFTDMSKMIGVKNAIYTTATLSTLYIEMNMLIIYVFLFYSEGEKNVACCFNLSHSISPV